MSKLVRLVLFGGAGAFAYGLWEPFRYRLTELDVPVRWEGPPMRVLHLSDTHLAPGDTRLRRFLRELPSRLDTTPDLVLATGDMIEGDDAIDPLLEALAPIQARSGRFYVLGSHDYFVGSGPSYSKYFSGEKTVSRAKHTDSDRLEEGLREQGWVALSNATHHIDVQGHTVRLAGVDDPYLKRHDIAHIERGRDDELAIGLMHAPDITSSWALNRFDLALAGHTHAGQVRLPGVGAIVTNCSLPSALASGLNRVGHTWLHVSPGLGTGKYSPLRFLAPPEATLLRLVPSR
jgi:predicted MPP superfamily phosphohydrolase